MSFTFPIPSAPASAVLDDSNNLTLSWSPIADSNGFTDYNHWDITVDATLFRFPSSGSIQPYAGGSLTFTQTLGAGSHSLTMTAFNSTDDSVPLTLPWQTSGVNASRPFPAVLTATDVLLSLSSVELGQTFTLTLSNIYTGADQWQVLWPDNTSTGWLPLSNNVVAKSFSTPGAQNIIVQARRNYSASIYNPPASLIRQTSVQIFVIDQQFSSTPASQGGLTGDLGIGGQQGFEITDASSNAAIPNPWEVIARGIVRDTVTNELKLLVATTRFSNASSLLGTMAIDVFPIPSRPHDIELIEPIFELEVGNTSTSPVKIATTTLPTLIVGKSVTQALGGTFQMLTKASTGVAPFLWSATGLPAGVTMSSNGVINGVPLALGTFTVVFAVQDSDVPFSIDEASLTLTVATDLAVQIATGQKDANGTTLSPLGTTLGVAQVLKPYSVTMQVGNTNPNATAAGGLPPYTWNVAAGALPIGLSIDPATGIIGGLPCTYNSTSDYGKTFTAIIQVTDAIGAKATQTYTMTLEAAPLQFSLSADQGTIYSLQDFKLAVSIFGGQSPYVFDSFLVSPSEVGFYPTPPTAIVDGQVEVIADVPTTGTGTRTFTLTAHDSNATSKAQAIAYQVKNEIADVRLIPSFFNHYWDFNDSSAAPPVAVVGSLTGYTLGGTTITLSSVANHVGSATIYTGSVGPNFATLAPVGSSFTVQGFTNAFNNGVFLVTASSATTLTLNNPNGVAETNPAKAILNIIIPNGIALAIDPTVPQVTATGPTPGTTDVQLTFANAQRRVPLQLSQSSTLAATISREYTFLAHNDQASPGDIGIILSQPRPYIVGDSVFLNPRKPYFNSLTIPAFNAPPNTNWFARVQNGSSLPPGLSLDANTSLVYGKLVGQATANSVIEYVDGGGIVHGTVTVVWQTFKNDFVLIDSFASVDQQQIGSPYSPTNVVATAPAGVILSSPIVVYPTLNNTSVVPSGVSFVADNTVSPSVVRISGTPLEAGYFDIWLQVAGSNSTTSTIFHRLAVDYTKPMVILTSALPDISAATLALQFPPSGIILQGFGGIPPYTWSSPKFPGGSGVAPIAGLTLTTNADNTATISGQLTSPPGSSPTPLFTLGSPITITLTDTRGAASSVSKNFTWNYNNTLRITTPAVPAIPASTDYGFTMSAAGGLPPYQWQIANSPTLPNGITFDAIAPAFSGFTGVDPTAGEFTGTYTGSPVYSPTSINITVKDSNATTAVQAFTISTGPAALLIDQSKVTAINRGRPYQGTLTLQNGTGNFVTPISWQVAPTALHPNTILPGLTLQADAGTLGVNAIISGTYSGTPHQVENIFRIVGNGTTATVTTTQVHGFTSGQSVTIAGTTNFNGSFVLTSVDSVTFTIPSGSNTTENPANATATDNANLYTIRVVATDATNQLAIALVTLNTGTDLAITTTSLPNATVGGSYSLQLAATGGVTPYTWVVDPLSANTLTGSGLSLSSAGLISGTVGTFSPNPLVLTFRVSDSTAAPNNIARATFNLASQASGLTITTAAITPATSGVAYSFQMAASGSPNTPYTWQIIAGSLPSGLSMNSAGLISGTTTQTGFSQSITIQVTDTINASVNKAFVFSVQSGLSMKTGIDVTDGTSTNLLGLVSTGQVASINPRPNLSFYVIATGVISTSPATMSVQTSNPSIAGTVASVNAGTAQIALSGSGFDAGTPGTNNLTVTVNDNGIVVSQTFQFTVYNDGALRIGAALPQELLTSGGGGGGGFLPPFAFVQRFHYIPPALGGGQQSISFALSQAVSAGNTIVLAFDAFDFSAGSTSVSVTDNLGNTYNQTFHQNDGEHDTFLYYAHVANAGTPTITVHPLTGSHSNSFIALAGGEFAGFLIPETTDGKNGAFGLQPNASFNTGTISTGNNQTSDIVFSSTYNNNGGVTVPAGFTLVDQSNTDSLFGATSNPPTYSLAFKTFSASGTFSPTWTSNSGNFNGIGITVAFKLNQ